MSRESDTKELIDATVPVAQLWARRKAENEHAGEMESTSAFAHTERIAYQAFMAGVRYVRILEVE